MPDQAEQKVVIQERNLTLFSVFTGLFVATLILANVTSQKIFALGPFTFPGGAVIFPVSFIFGDILTEVYGYALTRKVIWIGFISLALTAFTFWIVGILPPASFWHDQAAYDKTLGVVPRVVAASILAYWGGEFCNSYVLSRMKYRSGGRRGLSQGGRFIASTIVGTAVDTLVFISIAFAGVYGISELLRVGSSLYLFKVVYEIVCVPVSTSFANWVKKVEGVDHIDQPRQTTYNPFAAFTSRSS